MKVALEGSLHGSHCSAAQSYSVKWLPQFREVLLCAWVPEDLDAKPNKSQTIAVEEHPVDLQHPNVSVKVTIFADKHTMDRWLLTGVRTNNPVRSRGLSLATVVLSYIHGTTPTK